MLVENSERQRATGGRNACVRTGARSSRDYALGTLPVGQAQKGPIPELPTHPPPGQGMGSKITYTWVELEKVFETT
ncbi:hypothetical protein JYU34_002443 [Plutella xylostella]|uniref:Uncharacterized protein n=1 Tax=Plutella xylostella TaxID=51655 RepID=A0ABQ7R286_PLUXY|nr:hypothetical protein JYU34_002443 [Plutella xylostella]